MNAGTPAYGSKKVWSVIQTTNAAYSFINFKVVVLNIVHSKDDVKM